MQKKKSERIVYSVHVFLKQQTASRRTYVPSNIVFLQHTSVCMPHLRERRIQATTIHFIRLHIRSLPACDSLFQFLESTAKRSTQPPHYALHNELREAKTHTHACWSLLVVFVSRLFTRRATGSSPSSHLSISPRQRTQPNTFQPQMHTSHVILYSIVFVLSNNKIADSETQCKRASARTFPVHSTRPPLSDYIAAPHVHPQDGGGVQYCGVYTHKESARSRALHSLSLCATRRPNARARALACMLHYYYYDYFYGNMSPQHRCGGARDRKTKNNSTTTTPTTTKHIYCVLCEREWCL